MPLQSRRLSVLLVFCCVASMAFAQGTKAILKPSNGRKVAPELGVEDNIGKQANLRDYRGKVVVLDFWATWCHGCKEEIPWFSEFEHKYGKQGFAVIGVSLDDDGWKVVKPFIKTAAVPYRIVLGNDSISKAYEIGQMPDTFVIDRNGRIAATYVGMVDRDNLDKNIRELLSER